MAIRDLVKELRDDGAYVRRYVPELDGLPDKHIHEPWLAKEEGPFKASTRGRVSYPAPAVDHQEARQRALQAYEKMENA